MTRKSQENKARDGQEAVPMDAHLVRVVCASCDANYRIAADMVSGKVVDYCCSNCGAVIEVNGTAIELVAPTRPGQDPRDRLPRTPPPDSVAPSSASFRVNMASRQSDTPAGLVRVKPPPPPTEAFAARRPLALHSSMPPAMSMPVRDVTEAERPLKPSNDVPPTGEAPVFHEQSSRRGWLVVGTLVAAIGVALLGRAITSLASAPSSAALAPPAAEPETPVATRLQPGDFRGTTTDPAVSAATVTPTAAHPPEVGVESLKAEKRRKKAKALKASSIEEPEPIAEEAPAEPTPPPFVAPEPPPPPGPEFSREAAQSALEDAAALAATCRQEDTTAGAVRVAVTFVPSGQATVAVVESGVVRGTPVGSCVASKFRTAKVPPFSGTKVTVHKTMMF
jgi:hypothetical protein